MRPLILLLPILALSLLIAIMVDKAASAPMTFFGGIRGDQFPITTVIEAPSTIRARAREMGFVDWRQAGGLATINETLTTCIIYVPPLTGLTLDIWQAEIKHCNEGQYHEPNARNGD